MHLIYISSLPFLFQIYILAEIGFHQSVHGKTKTASFLESQNICSLEAGLAGEIMFQETLRITKNQ